MKNANFERGRTLFYGICCVYSPLPTRKSNKGQGLLGPLHMIHRTYVSKYICDHEIKTPNQGLSLQRPSDSYAQILPLPIDFSTARFLLTNFFVTT